MKIVHVIDYFQPMVGYHETFLDKEHARMGHDVYIIRSDRYNPILYSSNALKNSVIINYSYLPYLCTVFIIVVKFSNGISFTELIVAAINLPSTFRVFTTSFT